LWTRETVLSAALTNAIAAVTTGPAEAVVKAIVAVFASLTDAVIVANAGEITITV
jgi:hypothetical protein